MTNIHPDLCWRIYRHCYERTDLLARLAKFLSHVACRMSHVASAESLGNQHMAKMHHQAGWPLSLPIIGGFSLAMRGKALGA